MFIKSANDFMPADFEKKVFEKIQNLESETNLRFSELEKRLIKTEVKLDYVFDELEFRRQFLTRLKNEFIKIGLFFLGMSLILVLMHFHIIKIEQSCY